MPKRTILVFLTLTIGACSSTGSSAPEAGLDQQPPPPDTPLDEGLDAERIDAADSATEAGIDRFAGIWRKEKTGAALVIRNDCGQYWRVDFDYAYSRITPASETTLLLEHCADATCTKTDSSTTTLTVQQDSAIAEETSELAASADCTIQTESSTTLTLLASDQGSLRWRAALTYVGSDCDSIKPQQTKGDSCEAIAQTDVSRLD